MESGPVIHEFDITDLRRGTPQTLNFFIAMGNPWSNASGKGLF